MNDLMLGVVKTLNLEILRCRLVDYVKEYVLIDWVGGPGGKIFGPRSWRTDRAQRGPCAMTEGQIFSRPARPNSVNKHFIIWPQRFSFLFLFFFIIIYYYYYYFFREIKFALGMFTYVAHFGQRVGI